MKYQEIEVHVYRKETNNIKTTINIHNITYYSRTGDDRTNISFSTGFITIDETYDNFKSRMQYFVEDK